MRFLFILSFFAFLNLSFATLGEADTINSSASLAYLSCSEDEGDCDGGCPLPPDDDEESDETLILLHSDDDEGGCDGGCPHPPEDDDSQDGE
jgi:hypothetical protein